MYLRQTYRGMEVKGCLENDCFEVNNDIIRGGKETYQCKSPPTGVLSISTWKLFRLGIQSDLCHQ